MSPGEPLECTRTAALVLGASPQTSGALRRWTPAVDSKGTVPRTFSESKESKGELLRQNP